MSNIEKDQMKILATKNQIKKINPAATIKIPTTVAGTPLNGTMNSEASFSLMNEKPRQAISKNIERPIIVSTYGMKELCGNFRIIKPLVTIQVRITKNHIPKMF